VIIVGDDWAEGHCCFSADVASLLGLDLRFASWGLCRHRSSSLTLEWRISGKGRRSVEQVGGVAARTRPTGLRRGAIRQASSPHRMRTRHINREPTLQAALPPLFVGGAPVGV
jgi:hypothetical protein